jgi:hypothetical protein
VKSKKVSLTLRKVKIDQLALVCLGLFAQSFPSSHLWGLGYILSVGWLKNFKKEVDFLRSFNIYP